MYILIYLYSRSILFYNCFDCQDYCTVQSVVILLKLSLVLNVLG